jgi:hypothetical protein
MLQLAIAGLFWPIDNSHGRKLKIVLGRCFGFGFGFCHFEAYKSYEFHSFALWLKFKL